MKLRALTFLPFAAALVAAAPDARATGALVTSPQGASSIAEVEVAVASAHGRTTRWARLRVKGSAGAFVWVVPVRPGGMIDLASDAWIEALEASTAPRVVPPSAAAPCEVKGGVDVTARLEHATTRAPSDVAVALDAAETDATLHAWGFTLPSVLRANVDTLFASGSRVALLLFSATSSDTTTRTVRVVDDAPAMLPLFLTSGASSAVAVTAFVFDDARAELGALPSLTLDPSSIGWRADGTSSWRDARAAALAASPNAWLVESAGAAPLFELRAIPGGVIPAMADSYFARAGAYGDTSADATSCVVSAHGAASSALVVAAACPRGALLRVPGSTGIPTCVETVPTTGLSPDPFRCGADADDLAHALSLRPPSSAWVTRAAGVVPAGVFGEDVPLAPGNEGPRDALVRASKYDVQCSTTPGGHGGYGGPQGGGSGGGVVVPPNDPQGGAVVGNPDDTTANDAASVAGDSCGGFAADGCGGDSSGSSSSSSSDSSCGGSSSSSSESSGSSCGGSSSDSSSSGGCGGSSGSSDASGSCGGSSSSSNCATSRGGRSPFSRWAVGLLAFVTLLRRTSRRRA